MSTAQKRVTSTVRYTGVLQWYVPVGELVVGPPPRYEGGHQTRQESRTVKEHVERVRDQTQAGWGRTHIEHI